MWLHQGAVIFCLLAAPAWARTYHYSWWSDNPAPYLEAIKKAGVAVPLNLAPGERIRAGIVPHHFLASGLMVRFFATLHAECSPQTIILIGPNHFHHGLRKISFSSLPWKKPFGVVETDRGIVQQVATATNLPEDPEAFTGEHSVGLLIPFVKYFFPRGRVVPILMDASARESQVRAVRPLLSGVLDDPKLLVLLSMDFSHGSVATIADSRDDQAQETIRALDIGRVKDLNVDCRRGLWLLLASLRDLGQVKVQINEHTNSARLTGKLNQPDATSYLTVYFIR